MQPQVLFQYMHHNTQHNILNSYIQKAILYVKQFHSEAFKTLTSFSVPLINTFSFTFSCNSKQPILISGSTAKKQNDRKNLPLQLSMTHCKIVANTLPQKYKQNLSSNV